MIFFSGSSSKRKNAFKLVWGRSELKFYDEVSQFKIFQWIIFPYLDEGLINNVCLFVILAFSPCTHFAMDFRRLFHLSIIISFNNSFLVSCHSLHCIKYFYFLFFFRLSLHIYILNSRTLRPATTRKNRTLSVSMNAHIFRRSKSNCTTSKLRERNKDEFKLSKICLIIQACRHNSQLFRFQIGFRFLSLKNN